MSKIPDDIRDRIDAQANHNYDNLFGTGASYPEYNFDQLLQHKKDSFEAGGCFGYSLASQQTSELKGVLSKIKNLALSRSQTLTAISGDEILKLIEDKVNL